LPLLLVKKYLSSQLKSNFLFSSEASLLTLIVCLVAILGLKITSLFSQCTSFNLTRKLITDSMACNKDKNEPMLGVTEYCHVSLAQRLAIVTS